MTIKDLDPHSENCRNIVSSDGKLLLQLNQNAFLNLSSIVRECLENQPEGGNLEVGGILVGTTTPDHSVVRLLNVVPIRSEHRFGQAFRPSEADLQSFDVAIKEHSNGPRRVIGYFRSHVGEPVAFRAEDENLLHRFFYPDGCLTILVHAEPDRMDKGEVWLSQWGSADNVRLLDRLPLVTTEPTKQAGAKVDGSGLLPQLAPQPNSEDRREPAAVPLAAKPESGKRPGFREASIAAAVVLVLLGIFAIRHFGASRRTAAAPVSLGMTVEVHGAVLEVKWNPASPVVRDSDLGALDFSDGPDVNRIELNKAQLRAGHFEYVSRESDIICVMTLHRNSKVVLNQTQFVHLDRPHNPTMASLPTNEKPVAKDSTSQKLPAIDQSPKPPGKSSQPPSIVARVLPAWRLEDPPKLARPESSPFASAFLPPRLDVSISQQPKAVDSASATFSAAVPIARESPVVSEAVWSAILHEVSLRVAVDVNSEGRVTDANALDASNPIEKMLAPSAVQAARQWRFSPARRNGTPVSGTTVVVFQFGKNLLSTPLLDVSLSQQAATSQQTTAVDSVSATFSAAVPIARESPVLSPAAWSAIRHEVSLRVAVDVNSEGRVTGAKALDASDPIEKLLAPHAEQATHLWRFNPARRNGTPIASTTVIVFEFGKN